MKLPDTLLAIIESTVNRVLQLDIDSQSALKQLDGKTVALLLTELDEGLFIIFNDQQTRWFSQINDEADFTLTTNLPTLIRLSFNDPPMVQSTFEEIQIQGDQKLGKKALELLAKLQLDWEEHLSQWVGDFPARKFGNFARGLHSWGIRTRHSLGDMIANFLQEESRLLVPRWRIENFRGDVQDIEKQVNDLSNRMQRLSKISR